MNYAFNFKEGFLKNLNSNFMSFAIAKLKATRRVATRRVATRRVTARRAVGTAVLTAVIMFSFTACVSTPPSEPVLPDKSSAVVYFFGYKSDKASVWDGETPIGDFSEGARIGNLAWKTKPGEHFFLAHTFNWAVIRANLKANTTYYVNLEWIPNPIPYAKDFVTFRVLDVDEGESKFRQSRTTEFSDEWRKKFAQGDELAEARRELRDAKADKSLQVRLR
jgi:hypothetical protein